MRAAQVQRAAHGAHQVSLPGLFSGAEVLVAQRTAICQLLRFRRVTVLRLQVSGQLLLEDSLAAAVTLPKAVPPVTLRQQVLRQAGNLHHLSAVVASCQHEAVLPVVQVQALLGEGLAPFPTEDAQVV